MTHNLKTINPFFSQVWEGTKTFEARKNDRDFKEGDTLILEEYDPNGTYLGRDIYATVSSILHGGQFGIENGFCVMSLDVNEKICEMIY